MTEFVLPKGVGRSVRLWIDDLPAIVVGPAHTKRIEHPVADVKAVALHSRVAVEMFQPMGGSFRYGLLGAEFSSDSTGTLNVVVPTESQGTECRYAESLAGELDEVIIGGTPQYAAAVIAGIEKMQRESLPSGRLIFSVMAHGIVGSAPIVFEMLAKAVVRLLIHDGEPRTADEVATLLGLG